jgi:hypothetical protein
MIKPSAICLSAVGFFASASGALSQHRLVIVIGRPDDPLFVRQNEDLAQKSAALKERDVVVQTLAPDDARHARPELRVPPQAAFEVLLIGKDGGVKLRSDKPVAASEIAALIDTMPMRQQEMKR